MARRKAASVRRAPTLWERLRARLPERTEEVMGQTVLRVLLAAFILVAGYLLIREMKGYVLGLERFQVSPATLTFTAVPSWVTPEIQQQIAHIPDLPERFSILERGLAIRVAEAYQRNPWVAEVERVERRFPNRLKVRLLLRRPTGAVRYRGSYYLVDSQAVRLPLRFRSWPQPGYRLPIVAGAHTEPPPSGAVWEDEAVRAGCAVAQLLERHGFDRRLAVTAVDAGNVGGRLRRGEPDIVLHTASRTRIFWGRSPLEWQPGDGSQTVGRKLLYLARLAKTQNLGRLEYADIRYDRLLVKDRS